jgi:hypothetical protein
VGGVIVAVVAVIVTAVLVAMGIALDVDIAGHDEDAPADAHNLDLRPIEARQSRAGDDVVDRAEHRLARAKVQDPVDGAQERIDLKGA